MALMRWRGSGAWQEPASTSYTNELALQALLAESPGLLYRVDPDRAVVASELVIPGTGRPDLTIVQPDGSVTLVECKLQANPEIRRSIVGQILAYASALTDWTAAEFAAAWFSTTKSDLANVIAARVAALGEEHIPDTFTQALQANLAAGRFRLILAVDRATPELRSIVEFLNRKSADDLEVVCVEFDYIADRDVEILIPNTYGVESATRNAARSEQHSEAEFRAALQERCSPAEADAVELMLRHAQDHPAFDHFYWGVGAEPSATPWFSHSDGTVLQPWTFYFSAAGNHGLAINFDWIHKRGKAASSEATDAFADAICHLPGVGLRVDEARAAQWRRRPTIPAGPFFTAPEATATLLAALDTLIRSTPT